MRLKSYSVSATVDAVGAATADAVGAAIVDAVGAATADAVGAATADSVCYGLRVKRQSTDDDIYSLRSSKT